MEKITYLVCCVGLAMQSCQSGQVKNENPFFNAYETPHEVPPFHLIKNKHYIPAYEEGMKQQQAEINAIINNPEAPTFKNTIDALEASGEMLNKVASVFGNQQGANTNDSIKAIAKEITPKLTAHRDAINLNDKLFARIKTVYENRNKENLTPEQLTVLDKYYKDFVRGGANLSPEDKETYKRLNSELSVLSLQFGENLLNETNAFKLVIDNEKDLSGLPANVIATAAATAKNAGLEGKWVFTLHNPSMIPFLQYADNRDLREKIYKAYINRCNNDNEYDNKEIIAKMTSLRVQKAQLLGYDTHAAFILDNNMAQNPENVYNLCNQIWEAALPIAKKEAAELQRMIRKEGKNFKLQPWDWRYYAEKVKKSKYGLDENELRQYFPLESVREGAFYTANKLFGITFTQRVDIPVPHPDALAFEVKEANGDHIGILYMDFHPRESKRSGAWMNSYRKQSALGKKVSPVITNVCNFTKPAGEDVPALLSFDEAQTLFHEFGHALHGLLSQCTYNKVSGTSVPRDFVELPSQIMENWASDPEVMKIYARHYQTGEAIPQSLIDKLEASGHFNQGFVTTEFMAAALLDMAYHTRTTTDLVNPNEFEKTTLDKIGLIPEIMVRYRSPYFQHIFAGGYSSGYYAYTWAEVLDADAFEAFKETGNIFNPEKAKSFRENILAKGGSEDAMTLYKRFRGQEPSIEPLLKRKGLK